MNNLATNEQLFFSRTLESSLFKISSQLKALLDFQTSGDQDLVSQLLKCGTVLSYALRYVQDPTRYHKLLSQLYALISQQGSDIEEEGAASESQIYRLRFLVAYSQCDSAIANDVAIVTKNFWQQTEKPEYSKLLPDFTQKQDSRIPNYLEYDYLMLLFELWWFVDDAEAYGRLERYCARNLNAQPYHKTCGHHRWIGFLAILPPPFKKMSGDILLQHIFRSNYLRSAINNDPWRFMEQVCLYHLTLPDVAVFRFISALFVRRIEEYNHSVRYAGADLVIDNTLALANTLLLYMRSYEEETYSEKLFFPDSVKSIWDTDSVLQITDGKLLPEQSMRQRYSMGTFISNQIVPKALLILPDENWTRAYYSVKATQARPFSLGATAVMTSHPPGTTDGMQQFILVRNTFSAMIKLALENRKRYGGKVVGITGSVGKTTTASMVHNILSHFGRTYKNISNFNHETGVPKSVMNIPQDSDYAILEMGMGRPGTILPKTVLVRPHIVIVTEIQHDHMEFHDSINSVIETKLEIIEGLEPGGTVILNRDSRHYAYMLGIVHAKGISRITTFGEHPLADIRATSIELNSDFSEIEVEIYGRHNRYKLSLPGIHMALNSLAVLAVLYDLGIDLEDALLQFQTLLPTAGRNEIFELSIKNGETVQVIDDSYNANPASMRSSFHILSLMNPKNGGRRVMVVGDMGELGEKSKEYHEELALDVNHSKIDIFYSVGEHTRYLNDKIKDRIDHRHFSSSDELGDVLLETLHGGDIISFKGSARAGDVKEIIAHLKHSQSG
jgi:UDP-N-acetylmuramoyl-tripeptide--D-alanyl-D-alanine ligase